MNIPNKIRIQGLEYRVEWVPVLSNGINRLLGEILHTELRIRLDAEQDSQRAAVTLWHEIVHAVIEQNGLELGDMEERVAVTMAFAMYQILEDNAGRFWPGENPSVGCADSSRCRGASERRDGE